jgi:tRNA(adenine34) deaminase
MNYDEIFMKKALELAQEAFNLGEVPVGAVIVGPNQEIISSAYNLRETQKNALAHAETLAIQNACAKLNRWRLHDCTLYVTLEPCFMCSGAIILARIPRVVYAAQDPKAGATQSLANVLNDSRLNHQCEVVTSIFAQESSLLLKSFFKARRK